MQIRGVTSKQLIGFSNQMVNRIDLHHYKIVSELVKLRIIDHGKCHLDWGTVGLLYYIVKTTQVMRQIRPVRRYIHTSGVTNKWPLSMKKSMYTPVNGMQVFKSGLGFYVQNGCSLHSTCWLQKKILNFDQSGTRLFILSGCLNASRNGWCECTFKVKSLFKSLYRCHLRFCGATWVSGAARRASSRIWTLQHSTSRCMIGWCIVSTNHGLMIGWHLTDLTC